MSTTTFTAHDLRGIDLFDELDEQQLAEWAEVAQPEEAEAGDVVADQGEHPRGLILLLEGAIQTLIPNGERFENAGTHRGPTWIGAISVLSENELPVRMQAETHCRLAVVVPEDFRRLAFAHPAVLRRVVRQVGPVLGRVTAIEQNRERLASLGTMAAGLAHELNNPAAAARRAAAQIAEALDTVNDSYRRFIEAGVSQDKARELIALADEAVGGREGRTALDALDAADCEDELLGRLEQLGVPEAWTVAEPLAAAGVDSDWLERVEAAAGDSAGGVLRWVAATLSAHSLADELRESTERMSALVGAVKAYAYMDRGESVEVDLHEGLETTLVVLGYKLKKTEIQVVRDYDRSLPKLTVRGSELNQVWTNLLDNAIDALGDKGTITVATHSNGSCAIVEISDDGPGIPDDIRDRIFDSFVTTKGVGLGTGLGLATARQIVVDRHNGSLTVDSEPGRTTFQVSLPFDQSAPGR